MDSAAAGRAARALELLHSFTYFAPEVHSELGELGLKGSAMKYVASRVAPMGTVGPAVATATFYNFAPRLIGAALPAAWEIAAPSAVYAARVRGVDAAMTRWLGADVIASPEMVEAAELAATIARSIPGVDGRALYAGYADQPWPEAPHLVFWHALTLLREYRGDGHVAVLLGAGLTGLDALVTHTASGIGFTAEFVKANRGWTAEEWDGAESALREAGLLDRAGALTGDGFEVRELVEDLTDDLGVAPWAAAGEEVVERLLDLAVPWRDTIADGGPLPGGMFGPRFGDAR
ncbi:hypothetical protein HCA61_03665 [Rhodococcus sp. HNM0563]|uniref:SCO6745 family protein n=1 Tax=Rhodococcus sp. HNM0563 TaxID=2716339 RepID=UPI00146C3EB3|nr:hypothetical protein [Rhodococcus sp. HNM0563]NLU61360.1 hypothetical protein [Rhodococcus sp. HNM0563]